MSRGQLARQMRKDGVPSPSYLLKHRYLVRVALLDAGGGSRSRTELVLRLQSRPKRVLGKAWADQPDMRRAQFGAADRCKPLPASQGGPEGHRCSMHFNGLGMRNLISAFTSPTMRVVTDPNNNNQGNVVLWLTFDQSQSGLSHRFVLRPTLPTFGRGRLSVQLYSVQAQDGLQPIPSPRLPGTVKPGWSPLGSGRHRRIDRAALTSRMRRDGVARPDYLLRHRYLVRLSVSGAGGGSGQRSEVVVKMNHQPKGALGVAWGDHRRRWGAQIGGTSKCSAMPRPNNPYGDHDRLSQGPRWHSCPVQYNGLGWRNLISAFQEKQVMIVTAPFSTGRGNQLLWLAFDKPQPGLAYRLAANDSAHRAAVGRIVAQKFVLGAARSLPWGPGTGAPTGPLPTTPDTGPTTPDTGSTTPGAGLQSLSGTHQSLQRNQLYWKIQRDGFKNPWYLLRNRYLVRVRIRATGQRADTLLRFSEAPLAAVGKGESSQSTRSSIQVGTRAKCGQLDASRTPRCPLHYGNLGYRNLITGLKGRNLVFVSIPPGHGQTATQTLWLAFDNPQSVVGLRHLPSGAAPASVTINRFRW